MPVEDLFTGPGHAGACPAAPAGATGGSGDEGVELIDRGRYADMAAAFDAATFGRLLETFLTDTRLRVARLGEAAAQGDLRQLQFDSHDLKSTAASLGLDALAAAAAAVEQACRDGRGEAAVALAGRIGALADASLAALDACRRGAG